MGHTRRRRNTRSSSKKAKARALNSRRRSSVVKKKTPTRTRRTIARLRTPVTRKFPLTKYTPAPKGRGTVPPPKPKTVPAKPVVLSAAARKRARSRRNKPVIRTTVLSAAQRKRNRNKSRVVKRVINKTPAQVKRNKRDRGFTKVTRVPPTFTPAVPVSRRAGRIVTKPGFRGARDIAGGFVGADVAQSFITQSQAEFDAQRAQYTMGGNDFNQRTRDLILAGQDRDIPIGNVFNRPDLPEPRPTVPSNPKDVVVNGSTFLNGKPISGVILKENGNTDGTRSPASRRYNIKSLLGAGKTFTAEHNKYKTDEYYTIKAVVKNETITTQVPVPPDDFVNPSFIQGGLRPFEQNRFSIGPGRESGFGGMYQGAAGRIQRQAEQMRRQAEQARLKPRFKTVTRTVEKTLIEWNYYKGGKLVNSSSVVPGQQYNAKFNFTEIIVPDDSIKDSPDDDTTPTDPVKPNPKPNPRPELLILHESNDNVRDLYAAAVNGDNVAQINGDTFKSKDAFQITLQAKQPSRYTISGYRVLRGSITGDQDTAGFQNYDVQELNITIDRPTTIIILSLIHI